MTDMMTRSDNSFVGFYEANIDKLVQALAATLGNPELAQDAAAEAMTRACQHWAKIDQYDNPMGWCYRVGINWANSRFRKRRREVITEKFVPGIQAAPSLEDDRIAVALLDLNVALRSVVVLRYFMDWSYEEIAEALDVPRGTVASRLHRALDQLRSSMPIDAEASATTWTLAA